jgi:5-methyltetrahydrofolate--homocysteine methyltransferase
LNDSKTLLNKLFNAVVAGDAYQTRKLTDRIVNQGVPANVALDKMTKAMHVVDKKYERKEYFTVDVAAASAAMREAFKVLEPYLKVEPTDTSGKVVIGSLKGNIQGLGKDIVAAALRSAGFYVIDLGVNVSPADFVNSAIRENAHVIAISVSINETVPYLKDVVSLLQRKNLSKSVKTIVGGRAVSQKTYEKYGVDAYGKDALEGVKKVKDLIRS